MKNSWDLFRQWTQARIGLKRAGDTVATAEWLALQAAHAAARDAVHAPWDAAGLVAALEKRGEKPIVVGTEATSRAEYLLRPDRGRRLDGKERRKLTGHRRQGDVAFCVSDGLSAAAVHKHFLPFWSVFRPAFQSTGLRLFPTVLLPFGRVAVADDVGETLGARVAIIAVGERPGMSASDSLGLYLTFAPQTGRKDAERNCLSNVRPPEGMSYELATRKLLFLLVESLRLGLSGVALKDESSLPV